MSISYSFDRCWYMHGACQYYALAIADLLGGKIGLWLDRNYDFPEGKDIVLCHAFACISNGLFIDADGAFKNISEREDEFEFNEQYIKLYSVEEAKKILKSIKVPYTEVKEKRNVREHLRNTMHVFDIKYGGHIHTVGLCGTSIDRVGGTARDMLLVRTFDKVHNKPTELTWQIPRDIFGGCVTRYCGEFEYKNWYYK